MARSELNDRFLADIPKDARILEVGCNRGGQLLLLREMGFRNVFGIEIQHYALTEVRELSAPRGSPGGSDCVRNPLCHGVF